MTEVLIPDASNWINALEAGKRSGMTDQTNRAKRAAGGLMASGDYKGAAQALYSTGDLETGSAVATAGQANDLQTQKLARADKVREFLAGGDYASAYGAAGTDADLLSGLDKVAAHAKETNGILAGALTALDGKTDEEARAVYASEIKPMLMARKVFTPQQLDSFDPTAANRKAMRDQVLGLEKSLDIGMKTAQQAETVRHNMATEAAPKYLAVPAGGTLERIDPGRGGGAPAPATNAAPAGGADPLAAVDGVVEATGAHVTSGLRSPERNAEVGGAPHSRHLTDQARDIVPPQGMTLAQLGDQVRAQVPGAKVIVENDHVHVQWDGDRRAGGGAPDTIHGAPKAATPPPSGYTYKPDGTLAFIPGGPADPSTKTSAGLKPVPAKVQSGYADNAKSMTQIDAAIAAIKANGGALGLKNKLGDDINQRLDPNGVGVRASVANIGSLLIHDRSGAAVTAAEQPRLMPFIPQVTDTAEAAIKKLQLLKEQYAASNDQIEVQFGEESGYRPFHGGGAPTPTAAPGALKADPQATAAAKAAIAKGAPKAAVIQRLREHGIDPAGI